MWRRFTIWFLGSAAALLGGLFGFVLLVDPYGNSPVGLPLRGPVLDINQRFVYPQIIRNGDHDAVVIGTSTSRLLEPQWLNAAFDANFANLAMNDARAWEQYQMMLYMLRHMGAPRFLLLGVDTVWCREDADTYLTSRTRVYPYWMYDDNPYNDLLWLLNAQAVEDALKKLAHHLGFTVETLQDNGYGDFTDGEENYDPERARAKMSGRYERIRPVDPPFQEPTDPARYWTLPALAWLEEIFSELAGKTHVMIVMMPVHVTAQPAPGGKEDARERECKRRLEEIATRFNATYADYRVPSDITTDDTNFWDPLHWRLHVGRQVIDELSGRVQSAR